MEHNLRKNAAKHVTVALVFGCYLNRLGNGATQASRRAGEFFENLTSYARGVRGRRGNACTVGAHDLAAEGL